MSGRTLLRLAIALLAGLIFGFGLSLSGMIDPARVLGFLDLASGAWDPSLIFVLGGAVTVAALATLLKRAMARPLLDDAFHMPRHAAIDAPLLLGSAVFGVGWGLAGFCPGPALTGLATGLGDIALFVAAMTAGMLAHDRLIAGGKS